MGAVNHYRIGGMTGPGGSTTSGKRLYETITRIGRDFEQLVTDQGVMAQAKAHPGTLTTRTDNDTGVITLGSDHQVVVGDVVNVSWNGGSRTGMAVTNVTNGAVTVDTGTGTVLPTQGDTTMVIEHFKVVADIYGIQGDALTPAVDKKTAAALFAEMNSMIAACQAALRQLVNRVA